MTPLLSTYFMAQYARLFLTILGGLLVVSYSFDLVELMRRASESQGATIAQVLELSVLKLPEIGQELFPFAILFAALACFFRMTRSQELVIARSAGVSVWQFVLPIIATALIIGAARIAVVNPVSAVLLAKYEQLDDRYISGKTSAIDLAPTGLWLRQIDAESETIIHARNVDPESWQLGNLTVFFMGPAGEVTARADAPWASLEPGYWRLTNVVEHSGDGRRSDHPMLLLPTDLTYDDIEDSYSAPTTLSFWTMPGFIQTLENTGLPTSRIKLHYQSLLAEPLLYGGLILIAAAIALRPPRQSGAMLVIGCGLFLGFGIFFIEDVVQALGMSGTLPVALAAWTPALVAALSGLAALLYVEDG